MRILDQLRLRKQRRQALNNIADYYIDQQRLIQQSSQQPTNYVPYQPGARVAPGDPVYNSPTVDPYSQTPPAVTQVHTEPDPELTKSVDQLVREMNQPPLNAPLAPQDARMNVIRRRVG
jgi:hypothetical protein